MAPSNFEKAEADRESIKMHLEFLEQEFLRHSALTLSLREVEVYSIDVDESRKQLYTNNNQLILSAPKGTDMDPHKAEYRRLYGLACRLDNGFNEIRMTFPPPSVATSAATIPPTQNIKLPPLELPKFSGNLQEWVSFRDMFITAVDKSSLTKVEKLTQLKSLLSGEAARQIRSLILSDTNYDIAWKSLQERYENNRELLFTIMKRLLNQNVVIVNSATHLRSLIDTTKECVRSLEVLAIPTQHWDAILLFVLFSKLDASSRELWEQSLNDTNIPPLSKMYEFLEQRARALSASNPTPPSKPGKPQPHVRANHVATPPCKLGCPENHPLYRCQEFRKQTSQQRNETVKRLKLCINCLFSGHLASACTNQYKCKICNKKHHSMIHIDQGSRPTTPNPSVAATSHHINQVGPLRSRILATARVNVVTPYGESSRRALIDGGSTNCYITEKAARAMNLPKRPCNIPMSGLDESSLGVAKFITSFSFKPHFHSISSFSATALVVKSIGCPIPTKQLKKDTWTHLQGLQLADPTFQNPDDVEILLGTDVFWGILENEKVPGRTGEPFAIKSSLGYLVAGENKSSSAIEAFHVQPDLDFQLRKFWEQETVFEEDLLTHEEIACETHFADTHKRDVNGRFVVSLPFKKFPPPLGSSRQAAIRRFLSLEAKYTQQKNIKNTERLRQLENEWTEYKSFMLEYQQLGHMELIPEKDLHTFSGTYYIPHHCVVKESSTTTKLRVVFDASAATTNGNSLNQCQMVGPKLQDSLMDIMLRFRLHSIVFTADVAKMYRQILVTAEDTNYQRILWRERPDTPICEYRLLTVTYGTASAPYLAVKCLQQLANDLQHQYPKGSRVALKDFYVDDTASGCSTLEEAKDTVHQLIKLCMSGGFELRKWTSNCKELLDTIPENLKEANSIIEIDKDFTVNTGRVLEPSGR